ncbi:TonB-dependent receptor [Acetobacter sp. TBRC 12305]|uniref:TonB-dependent receptor n=1 Tax=Acetobacter garciniae TaxID=2817435 RepID=A0A939HN81_9PROT|nr:TonB-dependent receptor [Acetobacter garciniae]MBO1324517.1 TonB-dependent receptor [Acetobacter garciniae]MBX0344206.1 TonB-dependent receptor [Acetobacter garciniae]
MRSISLSKLCLFSTTLVSLGAGAAFAQDASAGGKKAALKAHQAAHSTAQASAHAAAPAATAPSAKVAATGKPATGKAAASKEPAYYLSSTSETYDVKAHHITRGALVTVSQKLLSQAPPGTNPLKTLGQLPGVMFQAADGQGIDIWSQQFFMHGFQQSEVGFTLDGMPMGEQSLRNYNGLNAILAISSENVARIDVSQSAGAESVAATNNLGGSLAYVSRDPSHKLGGTVSQGFGSYGNYHTFIRFESGDLNRTGTRFYTSYMRQDGQIWKGTGDQFIQQVNAKLVQPLGEESTLSAFFDWADEHQFSTPDASPEVIKKAGYNVTNYYNGKQSGLQAAINAANNIFPSSFAGLADPEDSAYYDATLNSSDYFGGVKAHLKLNDHVTWDTTAYGHGETNQSTWTTPYFPSPNGSPLSELRKAPGIRRFGIISQAQYATRTNELSGGVWYENNSYQSPEYDFEMPNIVNGQLTSALPNPLNYWKNPFAKIFNQDYNTNTFTAFVQDTYHPVKNLALHFGFKSVLSTTRVGNGYANPDYYGAGTELASGVGLTTAKPFLPHISADWNFLKHHELFFDISENVHTYAECGFKTCASPFAVTQAAFDAGRSSFRPETDWTYAVGYRYSSQRVGLSLYGYRTNFNNRLQQITSGSSVNPISTVANVGGVTMNGVDAGLTVMLLPRLTFTNSFSYNHATYDNNLVEAGVSYHTKGVQIINYPRFMYKTRLSYVYQGLTAYADASFTSHRNFSYVGDVKVPAYWMSDLGLQYNFSRIPAVERGLNRVKDLTLSFSVTNLQNTHYISTMGENGNPVSISQGALAYQSFLIGAPRMFFGSISANF